MNRHTQPGFTLLELLVAIVVAGVVLGIGVPSLIEFQRNNAMASAANDFVTAVLAARSEAVKRGVPVTLCASTDPLADPPACVADGSGTNGGFIVWVDENGDVDPNTGAPDLSDATDGNVAVDAGEVVVRRIEAPGGEINLFMDGGYIAYGPSGFTRDTGAAEPMTRLLYCDDRGRGLAAGGRAAARVVQVELTGRAQVIGDVAGVQIGIDDLTAAGVTVGCP